MFTNPIQRRDFLSFSLQGIGATAALSLVLRDAGATPNHFPAKAKRVIHLCFCGGVSQIDTFDYKPELAKRHGKPLGGTERPDVFFGQVGLLRKQDWEFKQRGQSGLWISELFPRLAEVADELTIVRSMVAESSSHTPATFQENSGFRFNGYPALGSWLSYGLGNEADDLPAFVVLPDTRGLPAGGTINWSNGFLPAQHQGVMFQSSGPVVRDLFPALPLDRNSDKAARELQSKLNVLDLQEHPANDELAARIKAYELAAKMQLAVPRVTDLSKEDTKTKELYGLNRTETQDFGRSCLLARRLLEQGVRFVQLFSGGAFGSPRINWDGHEDMKENHNREAIRVDQPIAALIKDLRRRGMLDDTLILCTSEFGRTPFTQSGSDTVGKGRDHNQYGFTVWLAGAGLKKGIAYGATDSIGWKAVEQVTTWYDFHATVLHLLGIDHTRLTYYHNGIKRRLTNVHGEVIKGLLS
ncbi:DUF1501 domain-containing protein [Telmatocola sphagniphila]|uniref:DUF1501 domain-containing protein n=1 Tax=Telmatocola sphagniphila TaxID=1123043 RepID=A0A8E6F0I8_9BACT|nr:DUF1501 domain-containing protein [Telmatocola sphagniphila]QVL34586.1 DUF1501 domain-containing protein [Telmatocola sphagniphila]